MYQNTSVPPVQSPPRVGRSWLRVLLIGLVLFVITTVVMIATDNVNLYPTVILIGNFLVPVVFVAFLYDHQHISTLSPVSVATSFCIGGVLGVIGASILESLLIPAPSDPTQSLALGSALLIGLIEEGCKIAVVMFLARGMRHTSAMDGLLLGGAVGMGFAALESTGYAFTALLVSNGHISASIISTVIRGVLAPFGHGLWTAFLSCVLFQQSEPYRFRITGPVILAYLFVSLLHGFWDGLPQTVYFFIPPGIPVSGVTVGLSIIGVIALSAVYRLALSQHIRQTSQLNP